MRFLYLLAVFLVFAAATRPVDAVPNPSDVRLLQRAIAQVEQSRSLGFTSVVVIVGRGPHIKKTMHDTIQFVRASGGRFKCRCDVRTLKGRIVEQYQTIASGTVVWTYAPMDHTFCLESEEAYLQTGSMSQHICTLGLFGALLASNPADHHDLLASIVQLAVQSGRSLPDLRVNGKNLRNIGFSQTKGSRVRLLVNPKDGRFVQIIFTEPSKNIVIFIKDTLTSQTWNPQLRPSAFHFTPSKGTRRVVSVPIGFFPQ